MRCSISNISGYFIIFPLIFSGVLYVTIILIILNAHLSSERRIFLNFSSGLGLSITFNIVSGILGGTIRAESAPGKGAAMIVEIPAVAPAESSVESGRVYDVGR